MIQRYKNNNMLVQNSELFIVHESAIYHDEVNVLAVAVETLPDQSMLVTIAGCQKEQIWGQKSQSYGYGYWYKAKTSVIAWYSRASQQPKKKISNWKNYNVARNDCLIVAIPDFCTSSCPKTMRVSTIVPVKVVCEL
jgi:hypothetical protein